MLRDFFNDITIPVLANDGEIYQYVGDEVLVTWPNTAENKDKEPEIYTQHLLFTGTTGKNVTKKNTIIFPNSRPGCMQEK